MRTTDIFLTLFTFGWRILRMNRNIWLSCLKLNYYSCTYMHNWIYTGNYSTCIGTHCSLTNLKKQQQQQKQLSRALFTVCKPCKNKYTDLHSPIVQWLKHENLSYHFLSINMIPWVNVSASFRTSDTDLETSW